MTVRPATAAVTEELVAAAVGSVVDDGATLESDPTRSAGVTEVDADDVADAVVEVDAVGGSPTPPAPLDPPPPLPLPPVLTPPLTAAPPPLPPVDDAPALADEEASTPRGGTLPWPLLPCPPLAPLLLLLVDGVVAAEPLVTAADGVSPDEDDVDDEDDDISSRFSTCFK